MRRQKGRWIAGIGLSTTLAFSRISVDTKPSALAAQPKGFHSHFDFSRRVYKTVPLRRGLEMSPRSGPATHQNVENADTMFEGIRMLLVNRIA
jgi:hypothetical protein